jgi:hypothetical protein
VASTITQKGSSQHRGRLIDECVAPFSYLPPPFNARTRKQDARQPMRLRRHRFNFPSCPNSVPFSGKTPGLVRDMRGLDSPVILVEELRRFVEHAKKDARELFHRICFNALISSLDDHPRNHAVIAKDKSWSLSPAYDLTPSVPVSVERTYCRSTRAFCSIRTKRRRLSTT